MGARAKCSRCDYLRTFSDDLRGTFYRCPKCREGVIAVPEEGSWAEASDDAPSVRPALGADETPPGAHFGARASTEFGSSETDLAASDSGHLAADDVSDVPGAEVASDAGIPEEPVPIGPGKKPIKVRRILVECDLCGYHVAVPPELFGKTVHCPECRADMMFSESTLEPVKDEII